MQKKEKRKKKIRRYRDSNQYIWLLQCDKQMYKPRQNYNNVLVHKLLHASDLSGPTPGSAQLYKTNFQPFCHSQCIELSPSSSVYEYTGR